jgi:hypothetical protein
LVQRPKYWPGKAPGGLVQLERTKARPKPGLEAMLGNMEKTKEVEKEKRVVVEFWVCFILIFVG